MPRRRTLLTLPAALLLPAPLTWSAESNLDGLVDLLGPQERWRRDGITVEAPRLAETGNSVPLGIRVDAPPGAVEVIHVWLPENPTPHALAFKPGGRALPHLDTRVRLARSQFATAGARLHDGSVRVAHCEVIVTLGACSEEWLAEEL